MKILNHQCICLCTWILLLKFSSILGIVESRFEKRSILSYPARCGVSKVSYKKSTVMYKWEVQGLLKYLDYVKEFDETFVHETDHVKFTSPEDMNGLWKFKIQSSKTQHDEIPYTFASAKYTYEENSKNERMNIGMKIKIVYGPMYSTANEFMITKPSDKFVQKVKTITNLVTPVKSASTATITGNSAVKSKSAATSANSSPRRVLPAWFSAAASSSEEDEDDDEKRKEKTNNEPKSTTSSPRIEKYVEVNRVTVTFDTVNVQTLLENLRRQTDNSNDENSAVDLTFIIDYYIPNDPIVTEQMKCYIGNFTHQLNSFSAIGVQSQEVIPQLPQPQLGNKLDTRFQVPPPVTVTSNITEVTGEIENRPATSVASTPPFIADLEGLFLKGEFSDMNVVAEGEKIPVHRIILANSSPYLAYMIRTSSNLADFKLFDNSVGQNATREILRYIYTGKVKSLDLMADKILIGSHQAGLSKLEKMSTTYLLKNINIENAIRIYSLAKDVDSEALTKAAVSVIRQNKQAVVSQSKDFQKLAAKYPAIIFDLFLS